MLNYPTGFQCTAVLHKKSVPAYTLNIDLGTITVCAANIGQVFRVYHVMLAPAAFH
jgi:hypothetical protein